MNRKDEYDSYEIEEPSDEERAVSSEDELDILLNGTPDQKKKLIREYLTGESESSSGDEFEKEMEAELSSTMKSMEGNWTFPSSQGEASQTGDNASTQNTTRTQPPQYDNIYFDSDSDEDALPGVSKNQRRKQRTVLTNDELLYDPDEDDRDQAWVDARRKEYRSHRRFRSSADKRNKSHPLPSSDAVLNCPACMTTLCLDCQRHEKYRTQYRAMFVMNCTVSKDEVLRYKAAKQKNRRKKKSHQGSTATENEAEAGLTDSRLSGMDEEEIYHPVKCTECSTEVAVFDKDEVYHFFNILASHC
ncbi:E2F-associated phosphoprotein [Astyanax mexicanus]|uniref:E2F-associated phosphoprotein n=2 Tax=Astyanax mexicanus TaxID=7994 RepID=A0A8B9HYI1_ASTMX|nr:E2F-associated phosphoprotein [Astyanax mexicanus]KAG9268638.1 E2F-associated phosphoprotein [Astyanax mexicanus]